MTNGVYVHESGFILVAFGLDILFVVLVYVKKGSACFFILMR